MTRIEIPIEDARPGDIAVLKDSHWPSEIEAEVYERRFGPPTLVAAGWYVRFIDGTSGTSGTYVKRVYREVPDLPTEPGSIIRATISGVPDTVAFLDNEGYWVTSAPVDGTRWHLPEHIDLSTVVVGRVVFDGEAS